MNAIHIDFSKEFDIVTHCILGPKDIIVWTSGQLDGSETKRMVRLRESQLMTYTVPGGQY